MIWNINLNVGWRIICVYKNIKLKTTIYSITSTMLSIPVFYRICYSIYSKQYDTLNYCTLNKTDPTILADFPLPNPMMVKLTHCLDVGLLLCYWIYVTGSKVIPHKSLEGDRRIIQVSILVFLCSKGLYVCEENCRSNCVASWNVPLWALIKANLWLLI